MRKLGYVPALDGLRGVAIASVVGYHLFGVPYGGAVGVDLFFVLSGFLITTLLLEEHAATGKVALGGFYMRRARRLFPALAALLLVYAALVVATGRGSLGDIPLAGLYVGNGVQAFVRPDPLSGGALAHLWSLAEEEQFYAAWPLLLLLVVRTRHPLRWIIAAAIGLAFYRMGLFAGGAGHHRLYLGPDTHADGLLIGAALALWAPQRRKPGRESLATIGFIGFALAVMLRPPNRYWDAFGLPVVEIACVLMLVGAVAATPLQAALGWRPLVALGRISYSLYLWHPVIRFFIVGAVGPWLVVLISIVAAVASHQLVERRFRAPRASQRVPVPVAAAAAR